MPRCQHHVRCAAPWGNPQPVQSPSPSWRSSWRLSLFRLQRVPEGSCLLDKDRLRVLGAPWVSCWPGRALTATGGAEPQPRELLSVGRESLPADRCRTGQPAQGPSILPVRPVGEAAAASAACSLRIFSCKKCHQPEAFSAGGGAHKHTQS